MKIVSHHNNGIESKQIQCKTNNLPKNILFLINFIENLESKKVFES